MAIVKVIIIVDSLKSAINAEKGGAHSILLCQGAADRSGTTPSYGLLKRACEHAKSNNGVPAVYAMIRPCRNRYHFNEFNIQVMEADIPIYKELDCADVLFGPLTSDERLHEEYRRRLLRAAEGDMDVGFPIDFASLIKDSRQKRGAPQSLGLGLQEGVLQGRRKAHGDC